MTRLSTMEKWERTFSESEYPPSRLSPPVLTDEQRSLGRENRKKVVEAWKNLDLRQKFADEAHMRGFLVRYGMRIPSDLEPATPARLRTLMRRAGLTHEQWTAAVGCSLERFLELNPRLPLWAATALVLEAAS